MKYFVLATVFFSMVLGVMAQTNSSLVATNIVPGGRPLSLQDCIQLALKHNLDVQIEHYTPEIDLYTLHKAYGGYDVAFSVKGSDNFDVQPGGFYEGLQLPSETTKNDEFSSALNGILPEGLQYNISGSIDQEHFLDQHVTTNSPFTAPNAFGGVGVTLTQPLLQGLWIDQTRLSIKVAKNQLKTDEQGFRSQVISTVMSVQNAYYALIYALENVKVQEESVELAQTQLDQDKQRMQIGTLALLSVQQDESALAKNKSMLIGAEYTLGGAEITLKNLLTDNYSEWQNVVVQPTETLSAPLVLFNLEDSWSEALAKRPDLIQAKLSVETQGIQLKYDVSQIFPQLDVIGSYGWNGDGVYYSGAINQIEHGSAPYYSYGGQLSVPLGNITARNSYKADKVTEKQLVLKLKELEQKIMETVDNDIANAKSDYESVNATREARVYAEEALDAEQKTYAVGKATTFEVLQYQIDLTTARGNEIQALANYEEALATLDADKGTTLDSLGITLDVD
jgi:outer membrane protein TolC